MKSQKVYSSPDRSVDYRNRTIRFNNTRGSHKTKSGSRNNASLFSLCVNKLKLNELIRNSVRNIIIEEFSDEAKVNRFNPGRFSTDAAENMPAIMLNNFRTLTAREIEVIELVLLDFTNRKIGIRLNMSLSTVKSHMSSIISKLGVLDRKAARKVYRILYNKPELVLK